MNFEKVASVTVIGQMGRAGPTYDYHSLSDKIYRHSIIANLRFVLAVV